VRDFFCFLPLQGRGTSEEEDEAISEIERAVRKIQINKKVLESPQIVQVIGEEPKWLFRELDCVSLNAGGCGVQY
jgi:hypothetical protein